MSTVTQDRADRRITRRERRNKANRWDLRQARRDVLDGIAGRRIIACPW